MIRDRDQIKATLGSSYHFVKVLILQTGASCSQIAIIREREGREERQGEERGGDREVRREGGREGEGWRERGTERVRERGRRGGEGVMEGRSGGGREGEETE